VEFERTGGAGYRCDIAAVQAAAGQYREATASPLDERSKNGRASWRIGSTA